jgi:hypothetical protein
MPSTDTKPELTAKALMAQPVSQPAVYANGLKPTGYFTYHQGYHLRILHSDHIASKVVPTHPR